MSLSATNNVIYIPFVGEQYTENHIHNVFSNYKIGTIRSIVFLDRNYMVGTLDMGSVEETWGRPAIIEMENWEVNDFTRALNFAMNMGMTRSSVEFDGPDGDYWLIQKYEYASIQQDVHALIAIPHEVDTNLFQENNEIME